MSRTGLIFIAGLWLLGLVTGVLVARLPALGAIPTPHLMIPLIASLLVEIAARPAVPSGRFAPLSMAERATGVIGAAIIGFVTTGALAR